LNDSGANYTFSFEMLEAVLCEFGTNGDEGHNVVVDNVMLDGFDRAIDWIESNRLTFDFDGEAYRGWNSGGQLNTLGKGLPESWATGVVHMFLYRLEQALSNAIERQLRRKYDARILGPAKKDEIDWSRLMDINIKFTTAEKTTGIKMVLEEEIINPIKNNE